MKRTPRQVDGKLKDITAGALTIEDFKKMVLQIKASGKTEKKELIETLFSMKGMICHTTNKINGRRIVADCASFEYAHEYRTAEKLIGANYDVVFLPKGYFGRSDKRFDIFLCRDHIFLEADLKCLTTCNPDTISKRIKEGSEQSSRLVIDIHSNINRWNLIEGLKSGCEKNDTVKEILLFYRSRFYCLPKTQIVSKRIFDTIK